MKKAGKVQSDGAFVVHEDFWRCLFDLYPDPAAVLDSQFRIVRANQALVRALNGRPDPIVGRHCYEVFHNTSCPVQECPHARLLSDRLPHTEELEVEALGGVQWVSVIPVCSPSGDFCGTLHITRDVSRYKSLERDLRQARDTLAARAEAQARALKKRVSFEQLLVAFALDFGQARLKHDLQKRIEDGLGEIALAGDLDRCVLWDVRNARSAHVLARYERPGPGVELEPLSDVASEKTASWLFSAADRMGAVERAADGRVRCVTVLVSPDRDGAGYALQVEYWPGRKKNTLSVTPARLSLFCQMFANVLWRHADMASIQHMRDEMMRLEHVSRLGQLAGALAHELNQPLAAILCNAQAAGHWLAQTPADAGEARLALEDIVGNARHASGVIRQTRAMFMQKPAAEQKISVASWVKNALTLVNIRAALSGVVIEWTADASLPPVLGDRVQLQQVLVNLLNNAIDAVCKKPKASRHIMLSAKTNRASKTVQLSVEDTGIGFPLGHANKIFEPFFTTKAEGMGMGLAICRQIVENFGGSIYAKRNSRGNTVFCVTLKQAAAGKKRQTQK